MEKANRTVAQSHGNETGKIMDLYLNHLVMTYRCNIRNHEIRDGN
jgi:hypothetical protein